MDLLLTPEDVAFRDELRAFIEANRDALSDQHDWHAAMVANDWAVPAWPGKFGGRDATFAQQLIYEQELAAVDAPVHRNAIGLFNIGPTILALGTPEQQEQWLPPMVAADTIWCQGFSEPGAGSDLAALSTRATDEGDHWRVTGQKVWTTFAHEASLCMALVRTDPDSSPTGGGKHKGISALVIDMDQEGVEVRPLREITGEDGFNEIFFDGAVVPKQNLLGGLHEGWKVAMQTLTYERLGAMKLGIQLTQRLDQLVSLARSLGREGEPLVRQELARLGVQVELMQQLTEDALAAVQRGQDPGVSLPLGKLQWAELMQELSEYGVALQGPHGQLNRDPSSVAGDWQHHALYSRMTTIGAGTTQVQKNILAYRTLGLPRYAGADSFPARLDDQPADEDVRSLVETVRRFLDERCPTSWVRERIEEGGSTTDDVWKEQAAMGLPGLLVPAEQGGLGLGFEAAGYVLEELGRAIHPGPLVFTSLAAVTALRVAAPDDIAHELLPRLADGSATGTFAWLEHGRSWAETAEAVTAEPEGEAWRLSGTKTLVAHPDADLLIVTATHGGATRLFVVERDDSLSTRTQEVLDLARPRGEVTFAGSPARALDALDFSTAFDRIR
ncbi:MAG: acyl-CoA dehydrogenase family protein, partial [Nitriliruptorales bacterium]|nr:acyl-CoA dehydrogenase family protein [Nitriliruptorales bacterium]